MKRYDWLPFIGLFLISIFSSAVAAQLNEALFSAVEAEDLTLIQKAINNGASVNAKNASNKSLLDKIFLQKTSKNNRKLNEIAIYLIEQGHDIHRKGDFNTTYLHDAVENNMLEIAELLINNGIDTTQISSTTHNSALFYAHSKEMLTLFFNKELGSFKTVSINGDSLLHNACNTDANLQYIRYLLKHISIETKNQSSHTPLLQALISYHDPEEADALTAFLLANKADVNAVDSKQRNALQIALRNENLSTATIKRLIKSGANLSHQDSDGIQAIHFSAASHFDHLKLLYSHGMDLNATTSSMNETPLIIATKSNLKDTVKYLIKHKVKLNTLDKKGKTALNYARENDFSDIVMMLEAKKAKASSEKDIKQTALSAQKRQKKSLAKTKTEIKNLNDAIKAKNAIAIKKYYASWSMNKSKAPLNKYNIAKYTLENGNLNTFNFLISKGLDINQKDDEGYSLLHHAVYFNNLPIAKLLLAKKLNIDAQSNDGKSVLFLASNSSIAMINLLTQHKIQMDKQKDADIIKQAIQHAKPDVAEYFINKGFPFNIKDYEKNEILVRLISNEEINTISLLIKKGLNINSQVSHQGYTSTLLHLAIVLNKYRLSDFLINKGADVNARSQNKVAIFEDAVNMGNIKILKSVYDHGGLLNDTSGIFKRTPIHVALQLHQLKIIKFFINRGVDLNIAESKNLNTPLHVAAEKGYLDVIKHMIKKGAKPNTLNSNNETPFDLAVKFKQEATQKYLSSL